MPEITSHMEGEGDAFEQEIHWKDETGRVRHEHLLYELKEHHGAIMLEVRFNNRVVFASVRGVEAYGEVPKSEWTGR